MFEMFIVIHISTKYVQNTHNYNKNKQQQDLTSVELFGVSV